MSISSHIARTVDDALEATAPTPDVNLYVDTDQANHVWPRNRSNWLADVDLTCVSPWNQTATNLYAGCLVTPRHFILANHFNFFPVGSDTIRFANADGESFAYTVTQNSGPMRGYTGMNANSDLAVLQINADVDESISFAKVLPADFATYIPNDGMDLPCVVTNAARPVAPFNADPPNDGIFHQSKQIFCANVYKLDDDDQVRILPPDSGLFPKRYAAWKRSINGDSGSPCFVIINGEAVLLFCLYQFYSFGMSGPGVHNYLTEVNAAIASFPSNGGYQLTTVDLTEPSRTLIPRGASRSPLITG